MMINKRTSPVNSLTVKELYLSYLDSLSVTQNKIALLVMVFNQFHSDSKENNVYGFVGKICQNAKYDYELVLKTICRTLTLEIEGSHLVYINAIILQTKDPDANRKKQIKNINKADFVRKSKLKSLGGGIIN